MIAVPGQSAYNAAKFAVRGYTECLREELDIMDAGVSATCVHPGGIKTNIARSARMSGTTLGDFPKDASVERFDEFARTTPAEAAETILNGVRKDARRVLIGLDARIIDTVQRLLPTTYQRILVNRSKAERAKLL
jgi:hypothetical protein